MTAITVAPLSSMPYRFTNLGVLRKQECERVKALKDELRKCSVRVDETGDTLDITPCDAKTLGHATIHTYHDHRMAMCFATLGLACVSPPGLDPAYIIGGRLSPPASRASSRASPHACGSAPLLAHSLLSLTYSPFTYSL